MVDISYTATERETVIRSDDETKLWSVFTLQQTVVTKLSRVGAVLYRIDEDGGHWYKDLKFNQVSFRSGKEREVSEEQRLAASERAKKNFHGKGKESEIGGE